MKTALLLIDMQATATRALSFGGETVPAAHVQGAFLAALAAVYAKIVDSAGFLALKGSIG